MNATAVHALWLNSAYEARLPPVRAAEVAADPHARRVLQGLAELVQVGRACRRAFTLGPTRGVVIAFPAALAALPHPPMRCRAGLHTTGPICAPLLG